MSTLVYVGTYGSIPDFWKQDRFILSLTLTFLLLAVFLVIKLLYKYRAKVANLLRSKPVLVSVKALQYLIAAATIVAFILSFMPRVEQGMGGLLFFILWPLLAVQAFIAMLPWHKLFLKEPLLGLILFVFYCNIAVNIIIAVLGWSGYVGQ